MQVAEIAEDPSIARHKYAEYLRAVKERHSIEYETLKNAYRELSKGRKIIDLQKTLRHGGLDNLKRPRLAIARADASHCHFFYDGSRRPRFSDRDWRDTPWTPAVDRCTILPRDFFQVGDAVINVFRTQRALMPSIPPSIKPADSKLKRYHVLWEAEWENVPPVDPYLLKRISANIYVVIASWDLTSLERAVLAESFR